MTVDKEDPKKLYYVSSKEFKRLLEEYYESDKMTNELAVNIVNIAHGLSYNYRFINYTEGWKEEMIGDAIVKMYAALEDKKFKMDLGYNPFSYFNQIAWHAFQNRIKKEKKQHDGLEEYKQMVYEETMNDSSSCGHVYIKPIMDGDDGGSDDD